ncbi:MAG: hypothetical protein AAF430_05575 [Myxococcota bacterium]
MPVSAAPCTFRQLLDWMRDLELDDQQIAEALDDLVQSGTVRILGRRATHRILGGRRH